MIKKMRVADLKVGMYVIIPGTWMNHPFSRSQFQIKSTRQIQEIGRCGFYELEVDLEKSNLPTESRLDSRRPEERISTSPEGEEHPSQSAIEPPAKWNPKDLVPLGLLEAIEDKKLDSVTKATAVYKHSLDMMSRLLESPTAENIHTSKDTIKSITNLILSDDNTAFNMLRITAHDFYTYTHSINVGVTTVMLAKELFQHSDNHDLEELGAGFFLHDLGKVNVDPRIINKPGRLTAEEMQQMRTHPYQGYKILKEAQALSEESKYIVMQHHELSDGTGYPQRLRGDDIHIYGRICHLADVFDALTSERSYKRALSNYEALKLMRDEMYNHFDKQLFESFVLLFK
jgi:HD-GYP domain-containing protein (c-di-GMP phosphodiesterase class II)